MALAESALIRARTMMNDSGSSLWTNAVLMKFLDIAFQETQAQLRQMKAPVMKARSSAQTVPAGSLSVGGVLVYLVEPIRLWEAPVGSQFVTATQMEEVVFFPQAPLGLTLRYWTWLSGVITLPGATVNRDVFIYYWRAVPTPESSAGSLVIPEIETCLAPKIASLAMASVGQDTLAAALAAIGAERVNELVVRKVPS